MSNQCPGCNAVGCRKPVPVEQPIEGAEVDRSDLGSRSHELHDYLNECNDQVVKQLTKQPVNPWTGQAIPVYCALCDQVRAVGDNHVCRKEA